MWLSELPVRTYALTLNPTPLQMRNLLVGILFLSAAAPVVAQAPPGAAGVSGHAYVSLADGSSQLLRGTEVLLACATPRSAMTMNASMAVMATAGKASLQELANAMPSGNAAPKDFAAYAGALGAADGYLSRLPAALYEQMTSFAVLRTRTSFDGAYAFANVPQGQYFIIARYATLNNDMVWSLPVTITAATGSVIDLSNFNGLDVRRTLQLPAIADRRRALEQLVMAQFPRYLAEFTDGMARAASQAATAAVPSIFVTRPGCTG
jgi:hypothetical protein